MVTLAQHPKLAISNFACALEGRAGCGLVSSLSQPRVSTVLVEFLLQ